MGGCWQKCSNTDQRQRGSLSTNEQMPKTDVPTGPNELLIKPNAIGRSLVDSRARTTYQNDGRNTKRLQMIQRLLS